MEFQEALVRLLVHNHKPKSKKSSKGSSVLEKNHRRHHREESIDHQKQQHQHSNQWKIVSSKKSSSDKPESETIPKEFVCPISGSLMNDPVIVSSGHTFERSCVQACSTLGFIPILTTDDDHTSVPDFSSVIPNLALKSTIVNWCDKHSLDPPKSIDFFSAEKIVRAKMKLSQQQHVLHHPQHKETNSIHLNQNYSSSSLESIESIGVLQSTTRPSCFMSNSFSSSDIDVIITQEEEEQDEIIKKLKSPQVFEIEESLISLRTITRTKEESRTHLCTPRLLQTLRPLITSRYTNIQVNSVALLVNLSLEKSNKIKIVRSGILPFLIDVLKGGFPDAQQHASGAIFSLAIDDHNKTAIGVLGALPPLLRLLRSNTEWTRRDSALALYHLSLVQSNRTKLVKLGAVPILLGMIKSGNMRSRVLLILCNLASCLDGRAAMLDSGGVHCLVGMLKGNELESESTRESCVSVLYALSQSGLRFKGLAKAAGVIEVLEKLEKSGREQSREKVRNILEILKEKEEKEENEEINWEEYLLNSELKSRSQC
ncbi:U-box domain-containing protein 40-like [Mercurialis annua]|uniref:U-box domain-containing protein 40-like n=1 Tax=Mercurialis annua TaxID=3986 RepID=UPI00215E49C1|nr:U-box domain-containing protein 40-like [Mercurialis annua]